MKRLLGLGAAIAFTISSTPAEEPPKAKPGVESLGGVAKAELPAKVAEIVRSAPLTTRRTVAMKTVSKAVKRNPTAAPAIAGAAAGVAPELAPDAAAAAVKEQPKQAGLIARTAAAAAPSQAGNIVAASCRAAPKEYLNIVRGVTQAAPGAAKEILEAVALVFPALKAAIDQSLAASGGKPLSVEGVLASANLALYSKGAPPTVNSMPPNAAENGMNRPPFIPLLGNANQTSGSGSGSETGSGRNYATP